MLKRLGNRDEDRAVYTIREAGRLCTKRRKNGRTDGQLSSNLLGRHLAIWAMTAEPVRYASIECRLVFFVCQTEMSKK